MSDDDLVRIGAEAVWRWTFAQDFILEAADVGWEKAADDEKDQCTALVRELLDAFSRRGLEVGKWEQVGRCWPEDAGDPEYWDYAFTSCKRELVDPDGGVAEYPVFRRVEES